MVFPGLTGRFANNPCPDPYKLPDQVFKIRVGPALGLTHFLRDRPRVGDRGKLLVLLTKVAAPPPQGLVEQVSNIYVRLIDFSLQLRGSALYPLQGLVTLRRSRRQAAFGLAEVYADRFDNLKPCLIRLFHGQRSWTACRQFND